VPEREVRTLTGIIEDAKRPLIAVLGGAKTTDEIGVLDAFLDQADIVLVGCAMRSRSSRPRDTRSAARCANGSAAILRAALEKGGDRLRLPSDLVAGREFSADTEVRSLDGGGVADGWMGLDIGHSSAEDFAAVIAGAGTVFGRWPRLSSTRLRTAPDVWPRRSRSAPHDGSRLRRLGLGAGAIRPRR
jgi:phosphoglycerate kinase